MFHNFKWFPSPSFMQQESIKLVQKLTDVQK